jgi:hypothetical protein
MSSGFLPYSFPMLQSGEQIKRTFDLRVYVSYKSVGNGLTHVRPTTGKKLRTVTDNVEWDHRKA